MSPRGTCLIQMTATPPPPPPRQCRADLAILVSCAFYVLASCGHLQRGWPKVIYCFWVLYQKGYHCTGHQACGGLCPIQAPSAPHSCSLSCANAYVSSTASRSWVDGPEVTSAMAKHGPREADQEQLHTAQPVGGDACVPSLVPRDSHLKINSPEISVANVSPPGNLRFLGEMADSRLGTGDIS